MRFLPTLCPSLCFFAVCCVERLQPERLDDPIDDPRVPRWRAAKQVHQHCHCSRMLLGCHTTIQCVMFPPWFGRRSQMSFFAGCGCMLSAPHFMRIRTSRSGLHGQLFET
jgi:hypothetical protein